MLTFRRILLDTAGGEGGGAAPAPAAQPPAPPATSPQPPAPASGPASPNPPPETPATPQGVMLTVAQFQQLNDAQRKLAEFQANEQARIDAAFQEKVKGFVDRGQHEEALKALREEHEGKLATEKQRADANDRRARQYALDRELASALAGQPFVSPVAAQQFAQLVRGQLEAHPKDDGFEVRTATFQDAKTLVAELLGQADYAHFLRAEGRGGPTPGGNRGSTPETDAPLNPAQQAIADWIKQKGAQQKSGMSALGLTLPGHN